MIEIGPVTFGAECHHEAEAKRFAAHDSSSRDRHWHQYEAKGPWSHSHASSGVR
jgi:hypothetical protein